MPINKVLQGTRGYLIDFHRNHLPEVGFEGLDFDLYRNLLHGAHLDNLMVYTKDHWGWAYYPSKIGPMHPALSGVDLFGEFKAIAEAEQIDVCAYYSVDTDQQATRAHPEWTAIDPDGKPVLAGGRWRRCAITHGYRAYFLAQLEEILSQYQPKGLYLDCFPSVLCFCPHCQEDFLRHTGQAMPLGDEVHRRWRELHAYEEEFYWLPLAREIRALIDQVSPETTWTTNGCNANNPRVVRALNDCHMAEPWAGNYLSAGFARDLMRSPQIGPGNIGLVYDTTPAEEVARELLSIGMQGARPFLYSESMLHDGSPILHEWQRVSDAFAVVEQLAPHWYAELVTDIAIVYSEDSHRFAPERNEYNLWWWERKSRHMDAVQSAMRLAAQAQRGYRLVEEGNIPASADAARLLIVPNARVLSTSGWEQVAAYVAAGGRALVVLDGPPCTRSGADDVSAVAEALLGCRFLGQATGYEQNEATCYLSLGPGALLPASLTAFPLAVTGPHAQVEAHGAAVWGGFIAPVIDVDLEHERWLAWRPPNPGQIKLGPAVLQHSYGAGDVILLCWDALGMAGGALALQTGLADAGQRALHWPEQMLSALIEHLAPVEMGLIGASPDIVVSFFKPEGAVEAHLLNRSSRPAASGEWLVAGAQFQALAQARQEFPVVRTLSTRHADNALRIKLPEVELYQIVTLRAAGGFGV